MMAEDTWAEDRAGEAQRRAGALLALATDAVSAAERLAARCFAGGGGSGAANAQAGAVDDEFGGELAVVRRHLHAISAISSGGAAAMLACLD